MASSYPMPVDAPVTTASCLIAWLMGSSFRSGLHDDLDAAVLLGAERLVEFGTLFKRCAMCDDEGRINVAVLDVLKKLGQVMLHGRLRHPKCQPTIDC